MLGSCTASDVGKSLLAVLHGCSQAKQVKATLCDEFRGLSRVQFHQHRLNLNVWHLRYILKIAWFLLDWMNAWF